MQRVRVLPRARSDRLALRFAVVSLAAFAAVGGGIQLLLVRTVAADRRLEIDVVLACGLALLYALVLPLAMRASRTVHTQAVRLEEQTGQISARHAAAVVEAVTTAGLDSEATAVVEARALRHADAHDCHAKDAACKPASSVGSQESKRTANQGSRKTRFTSEYAPGSRSCAS